MGGNLRTGTLIEQSDLASLGFGNLYASIGDHIGYLYQTSEDEKNVLVSFLKFCLGGQDLYPR